MYRSVFPIVLIILMFSACDGAELMDADPESTFRQFVVGDTWIMNRTDSLGNGSVTARIDTLRVSESRIIDGEPWFLITSVMDPVLLGVERGTPWYTIRENGMWARGIDQDTVLEPNLYLPYPSDIGTTHSRGYGVDVTRVSDPGEIEMNGQVIRTIPYRLDFTDAFRPFRNAPESLSDFRDYPLNAEFSYITLVSLEMGFIHLESLYVSPDPDAGRARIVGHTQLDLFTFIPGD